MATVATKPITAEEFYEYVQRPENNGRNFDLVRGEIVEMPKRGHFVGFVCANIAAILGNFARQRRKGYVCNNNAGIIVEHDPDTVRGPDILYFENANSPEEISRKWGEKPARLSIEVLSPNDTHGKLMRRVQEQLNFGLELVWVVDPEAANVTVYRPGKPPYVVECDEEITGDDVLADFRCGVAEFFKMPG